MTKSQLLLLKILLSIPVAIGLLYPFLGDHNSMGILDEFKVLGPVGGFIGATVFLILIFLYAKTLMKCLELVSPSSQMAPPKSVWWMFVIPYNFIEDFFIVNNVSKSLVAEAKLNPALSKFKSFGFISGFGWCTAQIISLIPNSIGAMAGLVAILLWIWHWVFIHRAVKALNLHKR